MTATLAEFLNRDYKVSWRGGQLTTKSSWVGSLSGTQVFATVERNVTSSGEVAHASLYILLAVYYLCDSTCRLAFLTSTSIFDVTLRHCILIKSTPVFRWGRAVDQPQ